MGKQVMKTTITIEHLKTAIDNIDKISDEAWNNSLNERKIEEKEFHNKDRKLDRKEDLEAKDTYEKFYGNRKYYSVVKRSQDYVKNWIKTNSNGKVFLDYACGNGSNSRLAAKSGASLSLGLDISDLSIRNCRQFAKSENINNIRYFQADAENTKLPDNCVDIMICSGMLHHLDLSYAFPEIRRILKPGGKVLCVEALDYNPLIKLYRTLTPSMRTNWEKKHILSLKDIRFAKYFFDVTHIKYWHVIGYVAGKYPFLYKLLDLFDTIYEKIYLLNRLSWIFTFVLNKRENDD